MTFGINSPDPIPSIQPSQHTSDGGAGNLGYFRQEKKKKDDEKNESDTFESSKKNDENTEKEQTDKSPDSTGSRIKTFWMRIHGIFSEVVDEKKDS